MNTLHDMRRRGFRHPQRQLLRDPAFVDKSPAQLWARLLDNGIYLCSSTMYRILREHGESRERRRRRPTRRRSSQS
jgi:hypothetical protein